VSTQPLKPLRLLYDSPQERPFDLPDELRLLYGGPIGFRSAALITNFVSTIDGVVAIPGLPQSNKLISDGSEADRFVMGLLRACVDAVARSGRPNARIRRRPTPMRSYAAVSAALRSRRSRS
jgi:hypothetical protein